MVWCLLALGTFVALDVLGLRWFYARRGYDASCRCHQPWRGEYIANFGHPPEDVRLAPPAAPVFLAPPFRTPLRRLQPGADRTAGFRSAPAR